jgi:recombination protein RecT
MRIALTEARKNPTLLECDQYSFVGAVIQAAQLGLEPGSALGQCYLVPYKNKKKEIREVQFQIGYRGMIDLALRSAKVSSIMAREVLSGDIFEYEFGLNEKLVHYPKSGNPELTYVYAIVKLVNGDKIFDVMSKEDVEEIRKRSKSPSNGPWVSDYEAMAKKTVVRRLFKFTPVSVELQKAVGLDEMADAGISQGNSAFFESSPVLNLPKNKIEELEERFSEDNEETVLDESEKLPFEKGETLK